MLVGCQRGAVHCLSCSDGDVQWVQHIGNGGISTSATPIISANHALKLLKALSLHGEYQGSPREHKVNADLSEQDKWQFMGGAGKAYSSASMFACCANLGTVAWLQMGATDAQVAEMLHSTHLDGDVFSSPVTFDGRVVVGCRDNHLYCLAPAGVCQDL